MSPILEVQDLSARYGKVGALVGASLSVPAGSIVTVIGANGAGKSTLLNAVMGSLPQTGHASGAVRYDGGDVRGWKAERRVAAGMSLVPEKRELFGTMSVEDNLLLGGFRRYRARENGWKSTLDEVYDLFPRLRERRAQEAGTLSGGERQMLAVGRALMAKPRLLMLDEPSLGLAPRIVREIFHIIARLRQTGVAILLVEQNARTRYGLGTIVIQKDWDGLHFQSSNAVVRHRLFERFDAGLPGVTVLPCELFEGNADLLRGILLDLARRWGWPAAFADWLETRCAWHNCLVDRIVNVPPAPPPGLEDDALLTAAEPYALWAVQVPDGPHALFRHPAIQEACVIATKDSYRGESVKAVVVLRPDFKGKVSEQDIIAWCRENMAVYKIPRTVQFVDALPKSGSGKVMWRLLQEAEDGAR